MLQGVVMDLITKFDIIKEEEEIDKGYSSIDVIIQKFINPHEFYL